MKTPNIDKFLTFHPNLILIKKGEAGFGRPCVGILEEKSECYIDYYGYDEKYNMINPCTAAMESTPEHAYHKHPCLAVLARNDEHNKPDYNKALQQLEEWIGKILESNFEFYEQPIKDNTLATLLGNTNPVIGIKDSVKK